MSEMWCGARHPDGLACDIPKAVEHRIHEETFVGMWIGDGAVSWYQGERNGRRVYAPDREDGSRDE